MVKEARLVEKGGARATGKENVERRQRGQVKFQSSLIR